MFAASPLGFLLTTHAAADGEIVAFARTFFERKGYYFTALWDNLLK